MLISNINLKRYDSEFNIRRARQNEFYSESIFNSLFSTLHNCSFRSYQLFFERIPKIYAQLPFSDILCLCNYFNINVCFVLCAISCPECSNKLHSSLDIYIRRILHSVFHYFNVSAVINSSGCCTDCCYGNSSYYICLEHYY